MCILRSLWLNVASEVQFNLEGLHTTGLVQDLQLVSSLTGSESTEQVVRISDANFTEKK